jgi:hypothetical protein
MIKVEFKNASLPLSEYATKARKAPVLYKRGRPFAAVIPLRNADNETLALSPNRKFLKIIDRSRGSRKKRRRHFGGKTAPAPWSKEIIVRSFRHFDVSVILETWKFPPT